MAPKRIIGEQTLLDMPANVGVIAYTFRWEVLNPALEPIGSLTVGGNPQIRCTPASNITRQCSGLTVLTSDLDDLNLYRVRLRPTMVLEDGTVEEMGVFVPQVRDDSTQTGRGMTALNLSDQDCLLDEDMESSYGISANGSLTDSMIELLEELDISEYDIVSGGTTSDPIIWPAGTSRKKVLEDIAKLKGCLPPAFDRYGRYVVKPVPDLVSGFDHLYSFDNSRVLRDTISKSENLDVPNLHVVVNTGPTNQAIVGRAQVDRDLPYSVENIGRTRTKLWRMQGVSDSDAALEIAKMKAATYGAGFAEIQFATHIDPRHDVWDRVMFTSSVYLEHGWNMQVAVGGTMRHSITKANVTEDS